MQAGAPGRTRTADPLITNQVLYQLSYKGTRSGYHICRVSKVKTLRNGFGRQFPA